MMGFRLDYWSLIPGKDKILFTSPQCSDQLYAPPILLYSRHRKLFPYR
jgi:hypothetical protein